MHVNLARVSDFLRAACHPLFEAFQRRRAKDLTRQYKSMVDR